MLRTGEMVCLGCLQAEIDDTVTAMYGLQPHPVVTCNHKYHSVACNRQVAITNQQGVVLLIYRHNPDSDGEVAVAALSVGGRFASVYDKIFVERGEWDVISAPVVRLAPADCIDKGGEIRMSYSLCGSAR